MSAARLRFSWALLLSGACLLCYANGLTGAFTYDDKAIVRDNPRIRSPARIGEIFATQYFGGPRGHGTGYRPALLLSFAIQWWIHGGSPELYHVVNVLLHVLATLLLARLLLTLGLPPPACVGAALLFAVHPIHVEAVTSVVGRGETQAAVLVLAFLLLGLRLCESPRRWLLLTLALLCYLLANLTKENASVAPGLLFLCLAWRTEGNLGARLLGALRRGLPLYLGSAVVLGGVFGLRAWVLGGPFKAAGTGIFEVENPLARLAPAARAVNACLIALRYLGRMALPLRLSADESTRSIRPVGLGAPQAWAAAALLAAIAAAAIVRLPRRAPAALGALWLLLAALPTANLLFPTGTIFAERVAYLPSAGFCLIAGVWLFGTGPDFAALGRVRLTLCAAVVLLLAARTVLRNPVWASDEALFTNLVNVSPDSAKAHYDFAYMSAETGRPGRALEHYMRAIRIYPGYWDAWAGRGRMERALGRFEASEKAYAESIRLVPDYENGYFGMGLAREDQGNLAGAEAAYREGLRRNPQSLSLAYRLALLLSLEKRPVALHAWHRALAIDPASAAVRKGFADWRAAAGYPSIPR